MVVLWLYKRKLFYVENTPKVFKGNEVSEWQLALKWVQKKKAYTLHLQLFCKFELASKLTKKRCPQKYTTKIHPDFYTSL